MDIRSYVELKGEDWEFINRVMHGKDKFFETIYDACQLALAIGIKRDKTIEIDGDTTATIPVGVLYSNVRELSYLFKTAILTTNTVELSNEDRMYLAFSEEVDGSVVDDEERKLLQEGISEEALNFKEFAFLRGFAHYGGKEIRSLYNVNKTAMMNNFKTYLEELYKE